MATDDPRERMMEKAEELGRLISQSAEYSYLSAANRDLADDREAGLEGARVNPSGRIVPGDVIQEIDGKEVGSVGDLLGRLGGYRPGDTVILTVWRDRETREARVRLQEPSR